MNIVYFIRGLAFHIIFFLCTILLTLVFTPFLFFKNEMLFYLQRYWGRLAIVLLRLLCGLKYKLISKSNLPNTVVIFASKHQSVYETFLIPTIIKQPVFILKKELIDIPYFGMFFAKMEMIAIDRSKGIESLKYIIRESKKSLDHGRNIVIFPEGTRTKPGIGSKSYKPGISAIYQKSHVKVVPIALNSGLFWPSGSIAIKSGTVSIAILPAIDPGLDSETFMSKLASSIENKSLELYHKG